MPLVFGKIYETELDALVDEYSTGVINPDKNMKRQDPNMHDEPDYDMEIPTPQPGQEGLPINSYDPFNIPVKFWDKVMEKNPDTSIKMDMKDIPDLEDLNTVGPPTQYPTPNKPMRVELAANKAGKGSDLQGPYVAEDEYVYTRVMGQDGKKDVEFNLKDLENVLDKDGAVITDPNHPAVKEYLKNNSDYEILSIGDDLIKNTMTNYGKINRDNDPWYKGAEHDKMIDKALKNNILIRKKKKDLTS